jgi:hypothetical protein
MQACAVAVVQLTRPAELVQFCQIAPVLNSTCAQACGGMDVGQP